MPASPVVEHSFFRVCIACAVCAAERDSWARVATRNLFGAIDSCVLFYLVYGGFLDLCEQRVLLVVGTCRARPLHTITVLFHTQTCQQGRSDQASEAPLCRAKLERERGATLRLNKDTVTGVTSRFNAASERFAVMSVLGLAVTFLQFFMDGGGVHTTKLGRNRTLGGQSRPRNKWECGSVTRARLGLHFL